MASVRFDVGVTVEPNSRFRRTMEVRGAARTHSHQTRLRFWRSFLIGCLGTARAAQDAHISQPSFNGNPNWGFFSVLDGHGGKQAAEYSERTLAEVGVSSACDITPLALRASLYVCLTARTLPRSPSRGAELFQGVGHGQRAGP